MKELNWSVSLEGWLRIDIELKEYFYHVEFESLQVYIQSSSLISRVTRKIPHPLKSLKEGSPSTVSRITQSKHLSMTQH